MTHTFICADSIAAGGVTIARAVAMTLVNVIVTVRAREAVRTLVTTSRHVTLCVTVTTAALTQTVSPPSAAWTSYKNMNGYEHMSRDE